MPVFSWDCTSVMLIVDKTFGNIVDLSFLRDLLVVLRVIRWYLNPTLRAKPKRVLINFVWRLMRL